MSLSPVKTVLVLGATGKQGGAVINHLLASDQASSFRIVAVTRNPNSDHARRLAARPGVTVIAGDLSNTAAIFDAAGPVWGVFSVQVNSDAEERQGKAVVDAAVAHGVRHFVYSSGDRGGPERSAMDPTEVKNFAAKYRIEKHLEESSGAAAALGSGSRLGPEEEEERPAVMTWTILRPVTFCDNISNDLHGRGFARMWEQMGEAGKKLQLVSTADIGWFAAQSFLRPNDYHNAAITIAGDELSQHEANVIFREVVGRDMPMAPCLIGSAVKLVKKDTVGDMFRWFAEKGYGGDIAACRAAYPQMLDFKGWLQQNKQKWMEE